ncbi:Shedu anti-phage system protein SduA domain-containing protein [Flavobacterium muglaense]|uniref:DUF4263 domain-containing protein n=1 Tax=Flavobacterium muglaense TaxID=2764716 RepID=A0A923SEB1_9FLAO|nr:Shedu anti-phage system protein SduA domain-containing protein [Flavobacterium muglaense]MBC5836724.1 DUF4263 domain-containing protein [Flavobacterium muglaense]MBC5843326.1 DUF4263 domain-containing protein [Flavobacterium muglaense]
MSRIDAFENPFENLFNLSKDDITSLTIKENNDKNNCYLQDTSGTLYGGFIINELKTTKTICKVSFYKSSDSNNYLPRIEFRKVNNKGETKKPIKEDIIIKFSESEEVKNFWTLINFLDGFKEIVDTGDFQKKYKAVSFDNYILEFKNKSEEEKINELIQLTESTKLSNEDIKVILSNHRKKAVFGFYCLLKNYNVQSQNPFEYFRTKRNISQKGEEVIWHHFLKENDWIIGLNVDIKFIRDFLSEQKVGEENSIGSGSPKVDLLGISYFTTLIELKTSKTKIFKENKTNKSRANTWDFSPEFIEAYSQTLAQRTEISSGKDFIDESRNILDTKKYRILDPKSVLIIGNRNLEFPHSRNLDNEYKTDCFERLRRDIRNLDIITYDELFERAFHIVYNTKLPDDWYTIDEHIFIKDILKL